VIEAPHPVQELAERRAQARAERDFAAADRLRDEIAAAGWTVTDAPGGWTLTPAFSRYVPALDSLVPAQEAAATVSVLVEGWPSDAATCLRSVLANTGGDVTVQVITLGLDQPGRDEIDGAMLDRPSRGVCWHVTHPAGWADARNAALRADSSPVHVWCEPSTVFDGDAVAPLLDALADPAVVAAGWHGVNVDVADGWRSFSSAGPGEVDALTGYLLAIRRTAALASGGPDPRARYYRNADLDFCFRLKDASGGRVVAVADLPCHQQRHHGFHDVDPQMRERESRRNYQHFLERFRGREDLLAKRA
jgi:hypothetical protein